MGQILVRVEQPRKGVGGRTLLVVEGSFRKRPDVALFPARQAQNFPASAASEKNDGHIINRIASLGHSFY